jgi:actin-related protein
MLPILVGHCVKHSEAITFWSETERIACRGIKEKNCYVCKNLDREMQKFKDPAVTSCTPAKYSYTDKRTGKVAHVMVHQERFQGPELYFKPHIANLDVPPLPQLVDQAVMLCPIDARRKLYSSIWLSVRPMDVAAACYHRE